jgi:DNA-binding transcriptional LysR family regulator
MIPVTFRQLEVFVQAVEAGSFRACAEQLSISQASVGEHVRALEVQLNCTLFERQRGSNARLTHMGEKVFRKSQEILEGAIDLLATFDRVPRDHRRRRIRIGAHGFIAENLAKRLAGFVNVHPDVDIELQRRSYKAVISGLTQGEIEIGYFLARGPVPELESFCAWQEEMGLFASSAHPLAGEASAEAADLSTQPFAYLPQRTSLRGAIDSIMAELGIDGCPVAITSDDHNLIFETLAAGKAFACLFADFVQPFAASGTLVRLAFPRPVPPLQIRFCVREPYRADRTVSALLDALNRRD